MAGKSIAARRWGWILYWICTAGAVLVAGSWSIGLVVMLAQRAGWLLPRDADAPYLQLDPAVFSRSFLPALALVLGK